MFPEQMRGEVRAIGRSAVMTFKNGGRRTLRGICMLSFVVQSVILEYKN